MALFGKATPTQRKTLIECLTFVVQQTQGPSGAATIPAAMYDQIGKLEKGLLDKRGEKDAVGNLVVFATAKGIEAITGAAPMNVAVAASSADGASKTQYALESGFVVPPPSKRGGLKGEVYPFTHMSTGQSFFVPATEQRPNPAKALASTVSSANKRFASHYPTLGKDGTPHPRAGQPTGKDGRQFAVRARTVADGEKANGARVYRVA